MNSLDWSKKFEIFSISRLSLAESGIPRELVILFTNEDMQAIAERIAAYITQEPIEESTLFVARLFIAENGTRLASDHITRLKEEQAKRKEPGQ